MARRGQSILRAITNRPLTIQWDKKWVQLKNKSMSAILTARKNTPMLSFFFPLSLERQPFCVSLRGVMGKTHVQLQVLISINFPELDFTGHLLITRCGIMPLCASQSLPDKLADSRGVLARVTSTL